MMPKKLKVEEEEMEADVVVDFQQVVLDLSENENKHKIPKFLKKKVNPKKEAKRIMEEM